MKKNKKGAIGYEGAKAIGVLSLWSDENIRNEKTGEEK